MFYLLLRKVFIIVFVVTEFTHLFNKCLHITYYVSGTSLRTENTSTNQNKMHMLTLTDCIFQNEIWEQKIR